MLFPPTNGLEKLFQKFAMLCLFVKTLAMNFAGMGGNGKKEFYRVLHVPIANNPGSPQSQTDYR